MGILQTLSVEYFARRFQAQDVVTEMEVEYWSSNWKKVDYICTLYGERVGVSVTRAMSYPNPNSFSTEIAYRLLHKKLYGLVSLNHSQLMMIFETLTLVPTAFSFLLGDIIHHIKLICYVKLLNL